MHSLDLHLHSTISDGRLSPGDVVRLAHAHGVRVMALTDHDSTDGLEEAERVGAELNVRVVPGIELSTDVPGASIHVLGLFVDYHQPHFQEMVYKFRDARISRAAEMAKALADLGAPVDVARIMEIAGEGSVGRPHVAQALLEAGHVATIQEAFDRFLAHGRPAYREGFRLEPPQAIELLHSAGGFAAWAHPLELDGKDWREFLPILLNGGVDGLEVYYSRDYDASEISALLSVCEENKLVPTVGSDYHGFEGMDRLPGSVASPDVLLDRLEAKVGALRAQ